MRSFEIEFSDLWTYEAGKADRRLPLSQLSGKDGHVHGLLRIKINGRALPYLGYFGPDDVCFNAWVHELKTALQRLRTSARSSYTYDEGEQGQPAFLFEREGDIAYISIVASELSEGEAHPDWQRVQFRFADLGQSVEQFLSRLREHVGEASPEFGKQWWSLVAERGGQ